MSQSIEILFENDDLLVVNKPAGLLCHNLDSRDRRGPKEKTILSVLKNTRGESFFLCHRLDRGTSGILCLAKNKQALTFYSEQFANGLVEKEYLTICRGHPPDFFSVDRALKPKQFEASNDSAKPALTHFQTLKRFQWNDGSAYPRKYALVLARPVTGRTHQIRRHLRGEGFPIIGDRVYGRSEHNNFFKEKFNSNRLLLHCSKIKINGTEHAVPVLDCNVAYQWQL